MNEPLSNPIGLRLPKNIDKLLREQAEKEDRKFGQFLRRWICDKFKSHPATAIPLPQDNAIDRWKNKA